MVQTGYLSIAVICVIVAVSFQAASALQCWRCSSDSSGATVCKDPFDSNAISQQQRRWSFVECLPPANIKLPQSQRPVCKKVKQLVNDEYVISRSCYWEDIDAHKNDCINMTTPSYIKTEFCETCTTDGCNGDEMNKAEKLEKTI